MMFWKVEIDRDQLNMRHHPHKKMALMAAMRLMRTQVRNYEA